MGETRRYRRSGFRPGPGQQSHFNEMATPLADGGDVLTRPPPGLSSTKSLFKSVVLVVAAQNEPMRCAAAIRVEAYDVALLVNRTRLRAADRIRIVNRGETAAAEEKPMGSPPGIHEQPDNVPFGVDAEGKGAVHLAGVVEVGKPALRTSFRKESVCITGAIGEVADDIAPRVDPLGKRAFRAVRILNIGEGAVSQQKSVRCEAAIEKRSRDIASFVDTVSGGAVRGARVIDRVENAVAKQETVRLRVAVEVLAYDIAAGIDGQAARAMHRVGIVESLSPWVRRR